MRLKKIYFGWLIAIVLVGAGLLAVMRTPKWRPADSAQQQLAQMSQKTLAQPPPADPGQGQPTGNLPSAMRLKMPTVAHFFREIPKADEHEQTPMQIMQTNAARAEQGALLYMFAHLAAEYKGGAAVVLITPTTGAASVYRAKIRQVPTTIIYGADHREVWRKQGAVTAEQVIQELAKLNVKPVGAAKPATTAAR